MTKNRKIIIIICICLLILGTFLIIFFATTNTNKTRKTNNKNHQHTNVEDVIVKNDNNKSEQNNNNSKIDIYPKDKKEIIYANLNEDEKLLFDFGFYEDIGCRKTIINSNYSEEFKMFLALKKVDTKNTSKKKCSEIYSDSQLTDDFYKTDYGICGKNANTVLIPYDEANKIYRKMYNTDMKKTGFSTLSINSMFYNFYDYNESFNSFIQLNCGFCGGTCGNNMSIMKIKSSNETNYKKIIEVYSSEGELKQVNDVLVFEKKDNHQLSLKARDYESAEKEILTDKINELDVYEITFNKNNNNYIFDSFSKK